jgi:gliding motility-associated-like protein
LYSNTFQTSLLTRRISFVVSDGTDSSQPFQKFIEFSGNINRPPFLVDGSNNPVTELSFQTDEDTPITACLTVLDPDGDPVSLTSITATSGSGTFVSTGGLCFEFTPAPNFSGSATASVTICDSKNACASGTVVVTVTPVNDPPVIAGSAGLAIYAGVPVIVDNALTVTDADNIALTSATVTISLNYELGKDVLTFVPQAGITGTYDAGTGILTLNGSASLADYTQVFRSVTYSNADQFPSTLTRQLSFVASDGLINSQPFNRFIDVQQVNIAPRLTDGTNPVDTLYFTILEDTPLPACVNASDPNGDQVSIASLDVLTGAGTFTLNGGLCFTFVPALNSVDKVTARIIACDGASNSLCVIGGVIITILPVDDRPTITLNSIKVNADEPTEVCLTVTDVENDPVFFSGGLSLDGNATITNGSSSTDLCFIYTPNTGFEGIDLIDVTVCEVGDPLFCTTKTIPVEVKYPNRPPTTIVNGVPGGTINLTTPEDQPLVFCFESVDPDGDDVTLFQALNLAGGGLLENYQNIEFCFTFTPEKDFNGLSTWTITVCDNQDPSLCGTLTANITVTPMNDAPVAVTDTVTVLRNTVSKFNILANDYDIEGDSMMLALQPTLLPKHGQAVLSSDGFVTYTSDRYYRGMDSLAYEICDDGLPTGCSQAVVRIEIADLPLRIYEGVSPNGDGANDYWRMDGIDYYPENVVRVFDRYNNLVYEMTNYNNEDRVWRGEANRGIARGKLPDGVYFYSIYVSRDIPSLSGFVILKMEK